MALCFEAIVIPGPGSQTVYLRDPLTDDRTGWTWATKPAEEVRRARKYTNPYPPEFRAEAVRLVRDGGRSVNAAAKDLASRPSRFGTGSSGMTSTAAAAKDGLTTEERQELVRLRRENRSLREDKEILKQAAVFFAQETRSSR